MPLFTNNQTENFFLNGPQMGLTPAILGRLNQEGLTRIEDFADFKDSQIDQAIKNMRTAIPGVPGIPGIPAVMNQDGTVQVEAIPAIQAIPAIPPVIVSAKCTLRLKVASAAYHYYTSISRIPTPVNMNYTNVLRDFYIEWEAIIALADEDKPKVPMLTKHITPLKWIESFRDCLYRTYGIRGAPLLYVIRESINAPDEQNDPLQTNKAYGSSGSVIAELITRLNHVDPLFRNDNALVYSLLEEATRGTIYAPTIKPYARGKNGRSAWEAMVSSHAGKDKWEQLQKDKMKFLMNTKWNGKNYSLDKFTGLHRSAYVQLEEASSHVSFQLPNEHSRVGYLLDNIKNDDPDLRAAIASVRVNTDNMRDHFEKAAAFLLPVDPYAKSKVAQSQRANISSTLQGIGKSKTGVDLRWHQPDEYEKLSPEQKSELYKWQRTKDGRAIVAKQKKSLGHKPKPSQKRKLQAKISALEEALKQAHPPQQAKVSQTTACTNDPCISTSTNDTSTSNNPSALAISSILKRKRGE